MTLFWHGHFATSITKVREARLMWRQNETLRQHALGDFGEMVRALARDPAMMRWLDLDRSRREAPNENFARELMELFTLGIGNYTEDDVKAAARAFTGWRLEQPADDPVFAARHHDNGYKHFLGRGGRFDGDDIVRIILDRPECARFVTRRIWEFLVSADPDPATLEAAAQMLRSSRYQIAPLLGAVFRSTAFYAPAVRSAQIKGPVEWVVQMCVALECPLPPPALTDRLLEQLGQSLFAPPNVRGWEGGRAWISSSTLILRCNAASHLVRVRGGGARSVGGLDLDRLLPGRRVESGLSEELSLCFFGATRVAAPVGRTLAEVAPGGFLDRPAKRAILQRLLSAPEYQLA